MLQISYSHSLIMMQFIMQLDLLHKSLLIIIMSHSKVLVKIRLLLLMVTDSLIHKDLVLIWIPSLLLKVMALSLMNHRKQIKIL